MLCAEKTVTENSFSRAKSRAVVKSNEGAFVNFTFVKNAYTIYYTIFILKNKYFL